MAESSAKILDEWVSERDFAAANGRTVRQIARMRKQKDGLPFRYFGREVMIHLPTAREWMLKGLITPNPSRPASRVPPRKGGGR